MKFSSILLLNILVFQIFGQSPIWKNIKLDNPYQIKDLSVDSLGFVWAISADGLFRFDGLSFEQKLESPDTADYLVLGKSLGQEMVIGTSNGSLLKYNPYTQENIKLKTSQRQDEITSISFRDDQNFALAYYGKGVFVKYGQDSIFLDSSNDLISEEVYDLHLDESHLVIATDQGVQNFDLEKNIFLDNDVISDMSDIIVTNICDSEDVCYSSNFNSSINKFEGANKHSVYHFDSESTINQIQISGDVLYIGRDDGLFTLKGDKIQKIYPKSGSEKVSSFTIDLENNLWLTSSRENLVQGYLMFQLKETMFDQIQTFVYVEDVLWIGNKDGLYIEDRGRILRDRNVTSLLRVRDRIWVGTFSNGIYVFDELGEQIAHLPNWGEIENESVLNMKDYNNKIYVSSLTGVVEVSVVDTKSEYKTTFSNEVSKLIGQGYTYSMFFDDEYKYFGNDREGLILLNQETETVLRLKNFNDGDKIGSVFSIVGDENGKVWFSSSKYGLGYVEDGVGYKFQQISPNDDQYTAAIQLGWNQLLFIRTHGVDLMNVEDEQMINYKHPFESTDNLPFLNNFYQEESNLHFVHGNQVYEFELSKDQKLSPSISLDKVLVDLDNVKGRSRFNEEENNIQFHFSAAWLSAPSEVMYNYKLIGFDDNWRSSKENVAEYPKLNAGEYVFTVKASAGNIGNESDALEYKFEITKAFYKTWWFRTLFMIFLFFMFYRWRLYVENQNKLKLSLDNQKIESQLINLQNQLNPHFLFNSFNTLMGIIEEGQIEQSVNLVDNLSDFYRIILDHSKEDLILIEKEIELIKIYVEILNKRFNGNIELICTNVSEGSLIPPLTFQLLVENAVKHNEVSDLIPLVITIEEEEHLIRIQNNRKIKQYNVKSSGSGLSNIRKRYELLAGKNIQVKETPTEFVVELPIIHNK